MNRDEKNLQTRRRIMDSALVEFSEKSYGEASLNTVCAVGHLSKGIIYHYFKDKEELYLACAKECFDALTDYLTGISLKADVPAEQALEQYFDARIAFFGEHPLYLKLFCNTRFAPPAALREAMDEVTADFDALNLAVLQKILHGVKLRADSTEQEVVAVFREYQDFVNARFQMQTFGESTLQEHEERCRRSLKILLYGVVQRGGETV